MVLRRLDETTGIPAGQQPYQERENPVLKKWTWLVTALLIFTCGSAQAADDSGWDRFVQGLGQSIYFAAFPTATYKGVELGTIRPGANGTDVVFVVYGISAFDDDSLWTEVIITVKGSDIVDLRWGKNNAILSQPGETMKNLGILLDNLNKQSQANQTPSSTVRLTWVLSNRCQYGADVQVRFYDLTNNFVWPDGGKVFLVTRGATHEISIDTYRGAKVCIGAEPNVASPSSYWGVGVGNKYGCQDCCYTADNAKVSWAFGCL